jgi:hypothetical protein
LTEKKSSEKIVVYIGKDLFLSGPIRQAALSEGWTFRQEDPGKAETLSPEGTIVAVFDLSALKDEVFPLSETLRRRKEKTILVGISFHTDQDSLRRGQQAGVDKILHRSRMGPDLKMLLHEHVS